MSDTAGQLRPRPDYLRALPTLDTISLESDLVTDDLRDFCARQGMSGWRLELKLQRPGERYWLCTEGLPEPRPNVGQEFVVGHVSPEFQQEDGTWETSFVYGPENVGELQRLDYVHALREELLRLVDEHDANPSWELARQIDATREEMDRASGFKPLG